MVKKKKSIETGYFTSSASAVFLFFIFGLGILMNSCFPHAVTAATIPVAIKSPLSIVAPQSIDLTSSKSLDVSKITPVSPDTLSILAITLREVSLAGPQTSQSLLFKIIPQQRDPRNFAIQSQLTTVNLMEIVGNEQKYQKLALTGPEGSVRGEQGQPGLPGFTKIVAVPIGAKMQIDVVEGEPTVMSGIRVCPIQPMPEDQSAESQNFETTPPFIDKINYRLNRFLPETLTSVRYDILRGCKVAVIQVTSARYNPATQELLLYPDLTLNVSFTGGEDGYIPEENRSVYFESTFSTTLANYSLVKPLSQAELLAKAHTIFESVCDLLIITPEEFYSQAEALATWKREKGFKTWVRTLDQIQIRQGGTTAGDIRAYIKDIYTYNSLDYVLLMGDAEFIPPHYRTPSGVSCTPTDLYYAEMDGTGYFPDLAIGRMPVNSETESERVVNRTIEYEKNPPTDSSFYKRVILAAYFQDGDNNGRDDRNYVQTIQELYSYFSGHGYTVQREYVSSGSNPQYYQDGSSIPSDLKKPGFAWDGNASDIVTGLNSGAVLLAHRDHAGRSGWSHPGFTTSNLSGLDTGALSPVVFSINCQSGWFDNETDQDAYTTTESFAEQLLTMDGGALAVIAATRNSPTYPNDDLTRGLTEYIWPDFYLAPSGTTTSKRLGDVLNAAKMYVEGGWSGSTAQTEFELFHCLGDPTVTLWTKNPHIITLPWSRLYKEIQYVKLPLPDPGPLQTVTAQYTIPTPEENVLVSLIRDGQILGQSFSRDGQAVINVDDSVKTLQNIQISYRLPSGYTTVISGTGGPEPEGCQCDEGDYGTIDIGDAAGRTGDEVRVPIRIQRAEQDVEGIGFDVVYDSGALMYLGHERGPLSQSFDMFNVNDMGGGRIRIGGFDGSPDSNSIVQNSQGDLVFLKFQILSDLENCHYPLILEGQVDDVALFSVSGGCIRISPPCDGDLNEDGRITPSDALIAFRCSMSSGPCPRCCDVNEDGTVTPADAQCLFRKYMRLPSCLDENFVQ
ncbi:MAG: C25 family cysteine peptidase [bacterium]